MPDTRQNEAPIDPAILAAVKELGADDAAGADEDRDRARMERCSVTFVDPPDGGSLEIYSNCYGPMRGLHVRATGERTELTRATMDAVLTILDEPLPPCYDD